jgi:fumarate reductase flavoprotein subunit
MYLSGESDVIVVGGGGSGLAAAVSAAECGLTVLLLEKQTHLGGTTGLAIGSFTASRTRLQEVAGVRDAVADHADDVARFAPADIEARNDEPIRRHFLEQAADTFAWLSGLGLQFHGPAPEPPNRVPRMHNVIPNARAYILALSSRLQGLGGRILCSAGVTSLLTEEGRVAGVTADCAGAAAEFRARRGVVLAAGDYANSPELIGKYKSPEFAGIEGINRNATGDGQRLVESVGGQLLNMDVTYGPELRFVPPPESGWSRLLRMPASSLFARLLAAVLPRVPRRLINAYIKRMLVTWQHPEDALFADGAILINRSGDRFCDEVTSPAREIALSHQPDKCGYILLDERLIERYSAWPHFVSTAPEIAYAYVADYLRLRPDVAVEAGSVAQLARSRGLPEGRLTATVNVHNRTAARPLRGNRWALLGPAKAWFTTTEGGAAIDVHCRVLNERGAPIPGLYAVGQNGLGGMILWGHGLHIAWALTSGRLVGREIAGQGAGSPGADQ